MLGLMCLAQGHNTVPLVRLDPPTPGSQVKQSITEPLGGPSLKLLRCFKSTNQGSYTINESTTYHLYSENDSLLSLLALTETDSVSFRQSHVISATVLSKKCQSLIVLMCLSQ